MNEVHLFFCILLFGAMLAQIVTGITQYCCINKQFAAIKKRSEIVSVGKGRFRGMNRTAVLTFDSQGLIHEAYLLSGFTVFARLRPIKKIVGKPYREVLEGYRNEKRMGCVIAAIAYFEEKFCEHE